MYKVAVALLIATGGVTAPLRCGWFENPTPGNAWLQDRDGLWIVGTQGGHQATGDWPSFSDQSQWVVTNAGDYGYGCACLRFTTPPHSQFVTKILSAYPRPLAACRQDPHLSHPLP